MRLTTVALFATLMRFAIGQGDSAAASAGPKFDVASIKPVAPGSRMAPSRSLPGGAVDLHNISVEELIVNSWHIFPYQIAGAPAWAHTTRYDISAKPDRAAKAGEVNLMLQALLKDRFGLVIHHETRTLPIYALVLAGKDGKPGPSLVASREGGCAPHIPGAPPQRYDPAKPASRACGLLMQHPRTLNGSAIPMPVLAEEFALRLGRTVIDMTGLKGTYDVNLEWTSDEGAQPLLDGAPDSAPPSDAQGATILMALREQLGLKIESRKAPVDVIVIDHIERPSAN